MNLHTKIKLRGHIKEKGHDLLTPGNAILGFISDLEIVIDISSNSTSYIVKIKHFIAINEVHVPDITITLLHNLIKLA